MLITRRWSERFNDLSLGFNRRYQSQGHHDIIYPSRLLSNIGLLSSF
jgi:hypothetical protein